MIVLLSPAKSLDYESPLLSKRSTKPRFIEDSAELISRLRKLSVGDVGSLMSISAKLAQLNHDRFATWEKEFTKENSRPAILAFTGDVYQGMELDHWDKADFDLAQKRIRILSGLYGVLRPLDLMQPYRLEMGTKFTNNKGKNLYEFWGGSLTKSLNADFRALNDMVFCIRRRSLVLCGIPASPVIDLYSFGLSRRTFSAMDFASVRLMGMSPIRTRAFCNAE